MQLRHGVAPLNALHVVMYSPRRPLNTLQLPGGCFCYVLRALLRSFYVINPNPKTAKLLP
jgi:hypothetical protein